MQYSIINVPSATTLKEGEYSRAVSDLMPVRSEVSGSESVFGIRAERKLAAGGDSFPNVMVPGDYNNSRRKLRGIRVD